MTVDATREDILRKSSAASGDGDDANYIHNRYDITQDTAYFPGMSLPVLGITIGSLLGFML